MKSLYYVHLSLLGLLAAAPAAFAVERDHPWAMGFWRAVPYEVLPNMVRFVRNL